MTRGTGPKVLHAVLPWPRDTICLLSFESVPIQDRQSVRPVLLLCLSIVKQSVFMRLQNQNFYICLQPEEYGQMVNFRGRSIKLSSIGQVQQKREQAPEISMPSIRPNVYILK